MATPNSAVRPDHEATLLRWSNALLEATLLYLLLAAWARPREGPAALLPLAAALALPAGLAIARLVDGSTVTGSTRQLALGLVSLAWAFAAAHLSASAAYWLIGTPRELLLLGILFGGQGSGVQPIAFWTSLLLWWRGVMLRDWQPNLDDALLRLRLVLVVGGAAVGLSAAAEVNGTGLVQLEQALGTALLLGLALLTTALARRQGMAGWIKPTRDTRPAAAPRASARLGGLAVGLSALAVLVLVGLGSRLLSHDALVPAVTLGWAGLSALLRGLAGLLRDWSSLLPHLPDPFAGWAQAAPVDRTGDESALNPPAWTGLLGLAAILLGIVGLVVLPVMTERQRRANLLVASLQAVGGGASKPMPPVAGPGPTTLLAMVLRLFRGLLRSPGHRRRARHASLVQPRAAPAEWPSIRDCYRGYLRWAAQIGCVRLPSETPDELLERLVKRLPDAAADSALLTTLYVENRYGGRAVSALSLSRAEQALGRLHQQTPQDPMSQPVRSKPGRRG